EFLVTHVERMRNPLADAHPWYVLFEVASPLPGGLAESVAMTFLEEALAKGIVTDAAVAASEAQARSFWCMRETISEVQKHEGGSIKHDVSVPVSEIPDFIAEATATVEILIPGARPVPFGHFGDGNIHFNVSQPKDWEKAAFLARWDEVADAVHGIVLR